MPEADPPRYACLVGSDRDQRYDPSFRDGLSVTGGSDLTLLWPEDLRADLLHVPRNYFRQARRYELGPFACLVNCVTDPDLNPRVLANISRLLKGFEGRVINRPEAVAATGRERVAAALAGIDGLLVPATLRIPRGRGASLRRLADRGALRLPAIVRSAGTHNGEIKGLCDDLDAVERNLAADGDTIVTEFVDYRSPDGLYRKFRVFCIGDRLVFRHIVYSARWNAHVGDRAAFLDANPDFVAGWRDWCEAALARFSPATIAILHRIRERIGLDYFGIDFGFVPDGRVLLFEANATMNFFPFPSADLFPFVMQPLAPAQQAFARLIEGSARN